MRPALTLLFILFTSATAHADNIQLNEKSIHDFYQDSKTVIQKSFAEYSSFTDTHTSSDVTVTINDETTFIDQKPQQQSITMDKAKLMQDLQENYDIAKQTSLKYQIKNIQISPDGKSATVQNESTVSGIISAPNGDGIGPLKIDSKANCTDTLIIGSNSEIQTLKSLCDSKTKITPH